MDAVAIIILNYLNYKDTIECIESIKIDEYEKKEIIVVDNNSNNESWDMLTKHYKDKIHLMRSEENVGFANGNNIGIEYARQKLNCSFVLLVNNDTVFKDKMLITELVRAYEPGVAVIGPRIVAANGFEQNPVPILVERSQVQEAYDKLVGYKRIDRIRNNIIYKGLKKVKVLKKVKQKLIGVYSVYSAKRKVIKSVSSENLVLHGACMMLTEDYFKYYNKLFPGTFLYYEENILTLITKKVGLVKKFINNVWIYHKEDQSSLMSFNNLDEVKQKYEIDSMKKCLDIFDLPYEKLIELFFKNTNCV